MGKMKWKLNEQARGGGPVPSAPYMAEAETRQALRFQETFPQYSRTPLFSLPALAGHLGVSGIYVKDESYRFGLNAFKVLGGAYAMGRYLAQRLKLPAGELSLGLLQSPEVKRELGDITFITATDGNHGRGVAWAARQLGQRAVVYMPKGSSRVRLENIRAAGAKAFITEWNYDECVRFCAEEAARNGWVLIQDTAWGDYREIPEWIMQGYATIALESMDQLAGLGIPKPTHMLLQAGVGSFAGAIQAAFAAVYGGERPVTAIVEPDKADCLYRSALAGDGKPRHVTGMMDTIMAGLACGEPNPAAWEILRACADMFISCPDYAAAKGMRLLGNPLPGDPAVISGESGAVTAGVLSLLLQSGGLLDAREALALGPDSHILLISTEGDTDPDHYRRIVWDGLYPSFAAAE